MCLTLKEAVRAAQLLKTATVSVKAEGDEVTASLWVRYVLITSFTAADMKSAVSMAREFASENSVPVSNWPNGL